MKSKLINILEEKMTGTHFMEGLYKIIYQKSVPLKTKDKIWIKRKIGYSKLGNNKYPIFSFYKHKMDALISQSTHYTQLWISRINSEDISFKHTQSYLFQKPKENKSSTIRIMSVRHTCSTQNTFCDWWRYIIMSIWCALY